jgi:GNAT superfamily N-acetyltransferase
MRNDHHQTRKPSPAPTTLHVEQTWQGCVVALTSAQLFHFEWHLLRLGDGTRRSRFGRAASDAFLRDYRAGINDPDWIVLGCFVDGHMRGAVELRPLRAGWRKRAEVAFTVEERWQGQGIGKALMATAVAAAKKQGVERIYLTCHALNRPMQRIAEGAGARIAFEGCECFAEIDVAAEWAPLALAS